MNIKNKGFKVGVASVVIGSGVFSSIYLQTIFNNSTVKAEDNMNYNLKKFDRKSLTVGERVKVQGKVVSNVIAKNGESFYVKLENGQGIFIYPKKDLAVKKGNTVYLEGKVELYKNTGEYQIVDVKNYKLISQGDPSEVVADKTEIKNIVDNKQGTFIELNDVNVSDLKEVGKYKNSSFKVKDVQGNDINVYLDSRTGITFENLASHLSNGDKIKIRGIVSINKNKLELKLYSLNDIEVLKSSNKNSSIINVKNIGEIQGESHSSPLEGKRVSVDNVVVTKVDEVKNSQVGFYVQDLTPDNNKNTSDAIYVISKNSVKVGDKLKIEGLVKEGYGAGYADKESKDLSITQIAATNIIKEGTAELPQALDISNSIPKNIIDNDGLTKFEPNEDAIDFWESIEGMRVSIYKPRVLGPQLKGEIYVLPKNYKGKELNNAGGLSLNRNYQNTEVICVLVGDRKYRAKAKDYFEDNIEGVVTYGYGAYKIDATKLPDKKEGHLAREKSNIIYDENKLTIASYNIENFSANNAKNETPESKVEKIANSFIKEVNNPDIISLIEVQDNNGGIDDGTVSGVKSGERLAKKIKELGGVDYKYTEIAPVNNVDGGKPGANIRVAFLYNPNRVKLVEKEKGMSKESAVFKDGHLLKNPSRIEPTNSAFDSVRKSLAAEFEFKGENIVVIANHLKSKRGDDALYGKNQPVVQHSLASRVEQAKIINNFVKTGLNQNPNLKFVLTGDFNDFEFSDTIKAVEGDELVSLLANHEYTDRYSYFYRGNNQSLDNILVSKNIADKAKFDAVHVNSSFMEEDGRASDHDPLLAQLDFSKNNNIEINNNNNMNSHIENDGMDNSENNHINNRKNNNMNNHIENYKMNNFENNHINNHKDNGINNHIENNEMNNKNVNNEKKSSIKTRILTKTGVKNNDLGIFALGSLIAGVLLLRKKLKNK